MNRFDKYVFFIVLTSIFVICIFITSDLLKHNKELKLKNRELFNIVESYRSKENRANTLYQKIYNQTKDIDKSLYLSVCINKALDEIKPEFEFINEDLIISIIKVESNYDRTAQSSVGAIGYMQIKQSTADWLYKKYKLKVKPDLYKTYNNIYYGIYYLNYIANKLKDKYPKSILSALVLLAYNEGPNSEKVKRMSYNGHKYINKVLNIYMKL